MERIFVSLLLLMFSAISCLAQLLSVNELNGTKWKCVGGVDFVDKKEGEYINLNRTLYGLIDWKNGTNHFVRIVGFTGVSKVEQIIAADTWTCNPQLSQNQGVQYGEYKNYEPSDFKEIYVEY